MFDPCRCRCGAMAVDLTPWCKACFAATQAESDSQREREWRDAVRRAGRVEGAPTFSHADYENRDFAATISKLLFAAGQRYAFDRTLILTGPSGIGKTSMVRAALRRVVRAEREKVLAGLVGGALSPLLERLGRSLWTDAFSLAQARRQHPIGRGESELVQKAFRAPVLILDEVGYEPVSEVMFELANRRYQDGTITVVTSGKTPEELTARYGDAWWRRFAERGAVVSDPPQKRREAGGV